MLILNRRVGETIVATIPPGTGAREISFMILGVKGNQARVGIRADPQITVDREEIHQRKQQEGR